MTTDLHLRLEPALDKWLTTQAKNYGIPKTKFIKQILTSLYEKDKGIPEPQKFRVGQLITGQHGTTYELLMASRDPDNTKHPGYYVSTELGLTCKIIGTSQSGRAKLEVVEVFPSGQTPVTPIPKPDYLAHYQKEYLKT